MPYPDYSTVQDVISLVNAKMTLLSKMDAVKEENVARDRVVAVIVESMVQAFTNAIDITVRPEMAAFIKLSVLKQLKVSLPVDNISDSV